jgi:hypothetical protein
MDINISEMTILDLYGVFRKRFVEIMNFREICKEACLAKICSLNNNTSPGQNRPMTICEEIKDLDHRTLYEFKNQCYNFTVKSNQKNINNCSISSSLPKCLCGSIATKVNEYNKLKQQLETFINIYSEYANTGVSGRDILSTINYLKSVLEYANNMLTIMDNANIYKNLKNVPKSMRILSLQELLLLPTFRTSARLKIGNVKVSNLNSNTKNLQRARGTRKLKHSMLNVAPSMRKINVFG